MALLSTDFKFQATYIRISLEEQEVLHYKRQNKCRPLALDTCVRHLQQGQSRYLTAT